MHVFIHVFMSITIRLCILYESILFTDKHLHIAFTSCITPKVHFPHFLREFKLWETWIQFPVNVHLFHFEDNAVPLESIKLMFVVKENLLLCSVLVEYVKICEKLVKFDKVLIFIHKIKRMGIYYKCRNQPFLKTSSQAR